MASLQQNVSADTYKIQFHLPPFHKFEESGKQSAGRNAVVLKGKEAEANLNMKVYGQIWVNSSTLLLAFLTYSLFTSKQTKCRPDLMAAIAVEATPPNGSRTTSPLKV
jgi:hypothetical protein